MCHMLGSAHGSLFSEYRKVKKSSKGGKDYSGKHLAGRRVGWDSMVHSVAIWRLQETGFNQ